MNSCALRHHDPPAVPGPYLLAPPLSSLALWLSCADIARCWLKLRVYQMLPLAEAEKAHRLLEGRQSTGKIILKTVG